jgi:hypothetical protein
MDRGSTTNQVYQQRAEQFSALLARLTTRETNATRLRVSTFLLAVAAVFAGRNTATDFIAGAWYLAAVLLMAGFGAAVAYHEYIRRQMRRQGLMLAINQQGLARLRRDWKAMRETKVVLPPEQQSLADDLDLFGHASLFQLLCVANTPIGIETLRTWLLEPASIDEIVGRQQAVAELAPQLELRQTLELEGRLLADRGQTMAHFLEWAEGQPWLTVRPQLLWLLRAMSLTIPILAALTVLHVISFEHGLLAIFVAGVANVVATAIVSGWLHSVTALYANISGLYHETARYADMFRLMYALPHTSRLLQDIKDEATHAGGGVLTCLGRLQRTVLLAKVRHSPLMFFVLYVPLQTIFLYDFHVLCLLEAWQKKYGVHAREWFMALGKLEALASLATLAHDEPDWSMPTVQAVPKADEAGQRFQAQGLGHPLLPSRARVVNDIELGPSGTFLLVTGSNMSGKSTLLRSVGVNAVLAQAGAPVCSERLVMPPLTLATSIRVHDSLEDGVSFYMAELLRLKSVVDNARNPAGRQGRLLLYLLDEILIGTNSRERHIAVERVMEHLLGHDTIGAVSTHDLELATSPRLAAACRCVHLRETLHDEGGKQTMTFDYRLHPGLATTSNALKLLEIVGLGEDRLG